MRRVSDVASKVSNEVVDRVIVFLDDLAARLELEAPDAD